METMGTPQHDDFQAQNDVRTLVEAEKIRMDKRRFDAALRKRDEMVNAMKEVGDTNNG